jgi:hypothetical protein
MMQIDEVCRENNKLKQALHDKDDEIMTLKMTIKTMERR